MGGGGGGQEAGDRRQEGEGVGGGGQEAGEEWLSQNLGMGKAFYRCTVLHIREAESKRTVQDKKKKKFDPGALFSSADFEHFVPST